MLRRMRRPPWSAAIVACCLLVVACGGGASSPPATPSASPGHSSATTGPSPTPAGTPATPQATASPSPSDAVGDLVVGGDRPVVVWVPPNYDAATPAPLLIRLHGYGSDAAESEAYLELRSVAAAHGMLYAAPNGTVDGRGLRFWNATDACCDFGSSDVDDSGYLAALIAEIDSKANVDPARVYLFGHSNGGFMSYRMACDHADTIAAIVSLAGATFDLPSDCRPASPVAVLQVHGTADETVRFGGGNVGSFIDGASVADYPGARETVEAWAAYDGCAESATMLADRLDLDAIVAGPDSPAETTVEAYADGCDPGGHVELWTIEGGSHVPQPTDTFGEAIVAFLLAHPKP